MKKIMMLLAVAMVAFASNAASFKWSATYIYSPADSTALMSGGSVSLYCDAISSDALSTTTIADGKVAATTFSSDSFVAGTKYDFYFIITADNKTYTSAVKSSTANATTTPTIGFGSQATGTQNAANWKSVPEPTTGLLLLLGLAGLALKRKHA